jgi:hypothetical protein
MNTLQRNERQNLLQRSAIRLSLAVVFLVGCSTAISRALSNQIQSAAPQTIKSESFTLTYDSRGLTGISSPRDHRAAWLAYGGSLNIAGNEIRVVPRDGLRQTFCAVLPEQRLKIEADRDGFVAGRPIVAEKNLSRIRLTLENRTGDAHVSLMKVSAIGKSSYELFRDGNRIGVAKPGADLLAELKISKQSAEIELVKK